jgi:hypothetical protein
VTLTRQSAATSFRDSVHLHRTRRIGRLVGVRGWTVLEIPSTPGRYLRHRPPPGPARSAASASHSGSPERRRAPVISRFLPRPPCRPACPVSPLRLGCSSAAAAPSLPNGQCICHLQLYAGRRRETRICLALFVAADEEERHAFFLAPRRHQQSITNDPSTDSP